MNIRQIGSGFRVLGIQPHSLTPSDVPSWLFCQVHSVVLFQSSQKPRLSHVSLHAKDYVTIMTVSFLALNGSGQPFNSRQVNAKTAPLTSDMFPGHPFGKAGVFHDRKHRHHKGFGFAQYLTFLFILGSAARWHVHSALTAGHAITFVLKSRSHTGMGPSTGIRHSMHLIRAAAL